MITDLLYFGHDVRDVSQSNARIEQCFIDEAKERFPTIRIKDAYDKVKGFRQSIELTDVDQHEYHVWLYARGWSKASTSLSLLLKDEEAAENIMNAAKERYPHIFEEELISA